MQRKEFGLVLFNARKKKKFGKSQVAKRLKFSAQFYGMVEKGSSPMPRKVLRKVCKLLAISRTDAITALVSDYEQYLGRYL